MEGGTPITVIGSHFSMPLGTAGLLRCRFNATVVTAQYQGSSKLRCVTPFLAVGYATFEVTDNGYEYTFGGLLFEVVAVSINAITPWAGPELGATLLTLSGSGAIHLHGLTCTLTNDWNMLRPFHLEDELRAMAKPVSIPASTGSPNGIFCLTPYNLSLPLGWANVDLSSFGHRLARGRLYIYRQPIVSVLIPSGGPVLGGTRVTLLGSGFSEVTTLRCRFGVQMHRNAIAVFKSYRQLECAAPPGNMTTGGGRSVELSTNAQQFSASNVAFTYLPEAGLSSIWPTRGVTEGSVPVTVFGSGFTRAAESQKMLLCRLATFVTRAGYINDTIVVQLDRIS
jgi:hypothetical protein